MGRVSSDLISGIAAAACFLGMWALLGTGLLWVSALLSVMVYVGLRLALPSPADSPAPEVAPIDRIHHLGTLASQFSDVDLRAPIERLCQEAEGLLEDCKGSDNGIEATFLIGQYLAQAESGLELFLARTKGRADWTREAKQTLSGLLGTIQTRFEALHQRVRDQDDQALASEIKVLTSTLDEVDRVCVNLKEGSS